MKKYKYVIKLGDKVKDTITGYEGVCTSITRRPADQTIDYQNLD